MFVVLDDVGYGELSCFGGLIDTREHRSGGEFRPALREHAHDRDVVA